MDKASIRAEILSKRNDLPTSQAETFSSKICSSILEIREVQDADSIGIYISFRNEVMTANLFAILLDSGKKIFAPTVLNEADMAFARLKSISDTEKKTNGIMEPTSKEFARDCEINVFVIPGLVFDLNGFRLGYGKGYYDRFLSRNKAATKIGAAYDFQIVDKIDSEPHDIKMDFVVTENRTIEV